mmetsp:Transcript_35724/g.112802  ORF Transcript_35724/g.112802 Transcript_35724/m.112802 type:complete len:557 (-) Transcript_35724:338-2008(-)
MVLVARGEVEVGVRYRLVEIRDLVLGVFPGYALRPQRVDLRDVVLPQEGAALGAVAVLAHAAAARLVEVRAGDLGTAGRGWSLGAELVTPVAAGHKQRPPGPHQGLRGALREERAGAALGSRQERRGGLRGPHDVRGLLLVLGLEVAALVVAVLLAALGEELVARVGLPRGRLEPRLLLAGGGGLGPALGLVPEKLAPGGRAAGEGRALEGKEAAAAAPGGALPKGAAHAPAAVVEQLLAAPGARLAALARLRFLIAVLGEPPVHGAASNKEPPPEDAPPAGGVLRHGTGARPLGEVPDGAAQPPGAAAPTTREAALAAAVRGLTGVGGAGEATPAGGRRDSAPRDNGPAGAAVDDLRRLEEPPPRHGGRDVAPAGKVVVVTPRAKPKRFGLLACIFGPEARAGGQVRPSVEVVGAGRALRAAAGVRHARLVKGRHARVARSGGDVALLHRDLLFLLGVAAPRGLARCIPAHHQQRPAPRALRTGGRHPEGGGQAACPAGNAKLDPRPGEGGTQLHVEGQGRALQGARACPHLASGGGTNVYPAPVLTDTGGAGER